MQRRGWCDRSGGKCQTTGKKPSCDYQQDLWLCYVGIVQLKIKASDRKNIAKMVRKVSYGQSAKYSDSCDTAAGTGWLLRGILYYPKGQTKCSCLGLRSVSTLLLRAAKGWQFFRSLVIAVQFSDVSSSTDTDPNRTFSSRSRLDLKNQPQKH